MELDVDRLHVGDNLDILRRYGRSESVDLVYLDPPFKSNRAYHLIFKDESGRRSDAQQLAFDDSWHWGPTAEAHYRFLVVPPEGSDIPGRLSVTVAALVDAIGRTELTAYLVEMAVRLVELHRILKSTGSLYLHCDPTASHYLKAVLDAVFGPTNFRNEIVWKRFSGKNDPKRYGRSHDIILYYTKSGSFTWNVQYGPFEPDYVDENYRYIEPDTGRRYRRGDLTAAKPGGDVDYEWHGARPYKGRHWAYSRENMDKMLADGRIEFRKTGMPVFKRYLDEQPGVPLQDLWTDIRLHAGSKERLGYPTQKPTELLDRIIRASTSEGDVILDPFCGCGTAIEAAIEANRRWIGIDVSDQAIRVINERFRKLYKTEVPTGVIAPRDVATARALSLRRPHGRKEFETWAINLIGGSPNPSKDRGVDGVIQFVGRRGRIQRALISVKSGKVKPGDMRDLKGAVNRERAAVGVLITLAGASAEMRLEATTAGEYEPGVPRLQIMTVEQALGGRRPVLPSYRPMEMFAEVPEIEPDRSIDDKLAELEDQIAMARSSRQRRELDRLERVRADWQRIRENVQRTMEAEEQLDVVAAAEERERQRRA